MRGLWDGTDTPDPASDRSVARRARLVHLPDCAGARVIPTVPTPNAVSRRASTTRSSATSLATARLDHDHPGHLPARPAGDRPGRWGEGRRSPGREGRSQGDGLMSRCLRLTTRVRSASVPPCLGILRPAPARRALLSRQSQGTFRGVHRNVGRVGLEPTTGRL
jgi:hypothetical protein